MAGSAASGSAGKRRRVASDTDPTAAHPRMATALQPVLLDFPVRGWSFYVDYDADSVPPRHGEPLALVREPLNPVDPNAISVCLTDRPPTVIGCEPTTGLFRIGYLPKEATPLIHELLAADPMAASGELPWPGVLGVVPGAVRPREVGNETPGQMSQMESTPPAAGGERRWITMTALLQVRVDPASELARTLLARWGLHRVQPSRALKLPMDGFPSRA